MIGTLILAAQGALADNSVFPGEDPEFIGLPAKDTYASHHANDRVTATQSAIPSGDPEFVGLPAKNTYASRHASDRVAAHSQPVPQDTTGN